MPSISRAFGFIFKEAFPFPFHFLILISLCCGAAYYFKKLEIKIEESIKSVNSLKTEESIREGKATYMPGSACVISATTNQTPDEIVSFAEACAKSHKAWLDSQTLDQ